MKEKILEFEDVYLPQYMKEFGVKSADELKIEAELQTILDPCAMCHKQMDRFQEMYQAKITVYSSGASKTPKINDLYKVLEVKNLLP